jgi:hypothetical protein
MRMTIEGVEKRDKSGARPIRFDVLPMALKSIAPTVDNDIKICSSHRMDVLFPYKIRRMPDHQRDVIYLITQRQSPAPFASHLLLPSIKSIGLSAWSSANEL